MNISAVRQGLATAADVIGGLNALGYAPDSVPEPCFYPSSVEITFDKTYGRGSDELLVTCLLLVSRVDDRACQDALDAYLDGSGSSSIKAALEAEETLGGVCDDVRVESIRAYRWFTHGDNSYLGAEVMVRVIGDGA